MESAQAVWNQASSCMESPSAYGINLGLHTPSRIVRCVPNETGRRGRRPLRVNQRVRCMESAQAVWNQASACMESPSAYGINRRLHISSRIVGFVPIETGRRGRRRKRVVEDTGFPEPKYEVWGFSDTAPYGLINAKCELSNKKMQAAACIFVCLI